MRRAIIFRYDGTMRRVRAAGAHGMDVAQFARAHVTVESAPIAARALREDQVVEVVGDVSGQVPDEYLALVSEPVRLVCAPMSASGVAIGVILADRLMSSPPLDESDRNLLWTLGKAAALASVARIFAVQYETARQLEHRIDLAREIHEGVIQRLFGVSMALDGDGELPADARERCASETQAALSELRAALQRPLGRAPRATQTTLTAEVERLSQAHPELGLTLDEREPGADRRWSRSRSRSCVRRSATPASTPRRRGWTCACVTPDGAFVLEVVNDGVSGSRGQTGMGLRLAALEALQSGGVVEFGEREQGRWQVRLVVPRGEGDG